jgi:hypothetical protein
MLKYRVPEVFLGALLALAIFALGAMFWSSQNSGSATNNAGPDKRSNASSKGNDSEPTWITAENLLALFTLGLVIVAGVQLRFFYVQLRLIRESLDDAKKAADAAERAADATTASVDLARTTAERQLRAYIVGTLSSKIRGFNTPKPITTLAFKNSGQTPAYNVRVWTSSAVAVHPMEAPPARPDGAPGEGASVGVIGPGGDFYNEIQSDIEVTQAERAEVIGSRCAYYVYGQISYRDSFGVERNSTFCHFFAGDRARRNDGPLATYHKWNEAT